LVNLVSWGVNHNSVVVFWAKKKWGRKKNDQGARSHNVKVAQKSQAIFVSGWGNGVAKRRGVGGVKPAKIWEGGTRKSDTGTIEDFTKTIGRVGGGIVEGGL